MYACLPLTISVSIFQFFFVLLLCGLLSLPALVLARGDQDSSHDNTDQSRSRGTHDRTSDNPVDNLVNSVNNLGNDVGTIQNAENTILNFFNDSKSKFEQALANLSSYLPLDINYTLTKAQECDIVKNNKEYYQTIGLILSAVLIVLGIIFSFIGKCIFHITNCMGFMNAFMCSIHTYMNIVSLIVIFTNIGYYMCIMSVHEGACYASGCAW